MKRFLAVAMIVLSLTACGSSAPEEEDLGEYGEVIRESNEVVEGTDESAEGWDYPFEDVDWVMKRCDGTTLLYYINYGGGLAAIPNSEECVSL